MQIMNNNLGGILLTFMVVFVTGAMYANEPVSSIRGRVADAATDHPLIGAHIILAGTNPLIGTTSDAHGNFHITGVPLGRHRLEVRYVGYGIRVIDNIMVTSGREVALEISLEEQHTTLEAVAITDGIEKDVALNELAHVSARTFSVEETERYAGSLGDPARMAANFAGVMTQNDSRNDIIIRGNSPSGVIWRMEGVEIANPNHFGAQGTTGGPVSMVNNNLLSNSDFLTGAFPAEYGNGMAGVFDLNLRSGNPHRREFTGQIGFNGFELGAEGPAFKTKSGQRASYLANYRYSTLGLMHQIGFDVGTGTAVPQYQDFTFLADIPGTSLGRFRIFGLWGNSFIELGRDLSDTAANQYNFRGTATDFGSNLAVAGISNTIFLSENTRLRNTLSLQQSRTLTLFDSVKTQTFIPIYRGEQKETKASFSTQLRHKINANTHLVAGLIFDRYDVAFEDSVMSRTHKRFITITDASGCMFLTRGYAQWQHRFGKRLTWNAGIHLLHKGLNSEWSPEPRLGLSYQITPKGALNAGFGLHSQLQPREVYFTETYHPESDSYTRSNKEMGLSKSNHLVVGYHHRFNNHFRIKTEAYYQHLYNIPVRRRSPEFSMINTGDFFNAPKIDSLINEGTGRNIGLELTVERFFHQGWYMLFTASVFDSKYRGYDEVLRNTAFNGNYVFNLLGGYEWSLSGNKILGVNVKTVWAGGKRYIPVDLEASLVRGEEVRDWNNSFTERYNDYFRTDLRISFRVNHKRASQEWALDLQNITNHRSIFMESYDPALNEVYQVYQQGFMPMMLYRIYF
jgi:hypothetical protein